MTQLPSSSGNGQAVRRDDAGLTRLRGRSPFGAAKARVSINLWKSLAKKMDRRVKPGDDALRK
jgi:hypothetical protein